MTISELLNQAAQMRNAYDKMLRPVREAYGITQMELTILLFLANNPGYDTATDIIRMKHLTKSHVSAAVCDLTGRGLLTAAKQAGNNKVIHLSPTPDAVPLIKEGQRLQYAMAEVLFDGIPQEDIDALRRVYEAFNRNAMKLKEGI